MTSLNPDIVAEIEPCLDHAEICSLIFLLFDHEETALQHIQQEIQSRRKHIQVLDSALYKPAQKFHEGVLAKWARHAHKDHHWQEKLLEALLIIKNYQIIRLLGQSKDKLDSKYLPNQVNTSHHVDLVRKTLFLLLEDLSNEQWNQIMMNLTTVASNNQISIPSTCFEIRECFLVFLMTRKLLQLKTKQCRMDFVNIRSALKCANLYYWSNQLENLENHINRVEMYHEEDNAKEKDIDGCNLPRFKLDSNQGTILIFNMEDYQAVMGDRPLTKREASQLDCEKLESTFTLLRFNVVKKKNCPSAQVLSEIRNSLKEFCKNAKQEKVERCFIVAILAHGVKDGLLGIDGKLIEWEDIRKEMRSVDTVGLPRVLVIQACKGNSQVVKGKGKLVVVEDGPSSDNNTYPSNLRDLFEFSSSVSGFAAFRSPTRGSLFIQSFCKNILLHGRKHEAKELLTLINIDCDKLNLGCNGKSVQSTCELTVSSTKALFLEVPDENIHRAKELVREWDQLNKKQEPKETIKTERSCCSVKKTKHERSENCRRKCDPNKEQDDPFLKELIKKLMSMEGK